MRHVVAIALFVLALPAMGHEGEDHGAPPPAVSLHVAPRASAATEEFEIVVVLEDKKLVVYVDRFASNEPVTNAKVEVEGAGLKGIARDAAPGTYVMDIAAAIPPARHPLTIGIEVGDTTDLLTAVLDIPPPTAGVEPVDRWRQRVVWIVAALLLLAGGGWFVAGRRKNARRI
ncbi:MAG: hypothetical protein IPP88_02395 [Betaproteobacteria bacterium]|nr:hypothetical protein [Betaproteobacteria bacterium]